MSLTSLPQVNREATRWGWVANAGINIPITATVAVLDLTNQGQPFQLHPDMTLNGDRVSINDSGWYRVHGLMYMMGTGTANFNEHIQWKFTIRISGDRPYSCMAGPIPRYTNVVINQPIISPQLYFYKGDFVRLEMSILHGNLTAYAWALRQSTRLEIERVH